MKIRLGTRKSKLAVVQTNMVADAIKSIFPDIQIEIVPIITKGDIILNKPLSSFGGKGVFVSEIERALSVGEIDAAVHSAKDLPIILDEKSEISSVLQRGDYRDILVTVKDKPFACNSSYTVGTGSLRRRLGLKRIYPDVKFADIRGNVDTRLRKLSDGEYDAVVLAAAGLERLGLLALEGFDFTPFDYKELLPAACQGIIAVESRKNDYVTPLLKAINHTETWYCFETEREALKLLNGDCTLPVAVYSEILCDEITLTVTKDNVNFQSLTAKTAERLSLAERVVSLL